MGSNLNMEDKTLKEIKTMYQGLKKNEKEHKKEMKR